MSTGKIILLNQKNSEPAVVLVKGVISRDFESKQILDK